MRNEIAEKEQYCRESFELYDKSEKFETRNIETQTDKIYQEKSIQCNIQKDTDMYAGQMK